MCWRPSLSGGGTVTRRSKRPGRRSAGSSTSGRLVAATTITASSRLEAVHLGEDLVERLLALVVAAAARRRAPRARPIESSSSMKMIAGDGLLGLLEEVAHARGADADDRLDELGGRDREERHARLARRRPARAASCPCRARRESSTPRGMRPPSFRYLSGFFRKSTTSTSSCSASSMPATSSKVTRARTSSDRRARERVKAPSGPSRRRRRRTRRAKYTNRPTSSSDRPERRSDRQQHVALLLHGLGVDLDVVLLEQLRQLVLVGEGGTSVSNLSGGRRPRPGR